MKKIVIDVEVLLDFLARRPGHAEAARVFDLCVLRDVKGFLCANTAAALASRLFEELKPVSKARSILSEVLDVFSTIAATETMLRDAIDSRIADYENSLIEVSGLWQKVDFIVTGNLPEFGKSRVPALTPIEFLLKFEMSAP